jgi:hypothetical protein
MLKVIISIIVWILMNLGIVAFVKGATSYEYDKEEL